MNLLRATRSLENFIFPLTYLIFLLSEQIYSLTNQVREGIKSLTEVEKAKKLVEQEKNEAQMTLEETEVDHQGGQIRSTTIRNYSHHAMTLMQVFVMWYMPCQML